MKRRTFIASCASGVIATTIPRALAQTPSSGTRAIAALNAAKQLQMSGDFNKLGSSLHSEALLVEPNSLGPSVGRAAVVNTLQQNAKTLKLLYFYYRQPKSLVVGNAVIVISNYEAGYDSGGQTIEDSGKSSNVVLLSPRSSQIALEVLVPNLYAGSYGALGTALSPPHFGLYPLRALGAPPIADAPSAGGGENDVLYSEVRQINSAWVSGNANDLLRYGDTAGVFLIGDYSVFYITGADDVKKHFADFYKTSKVNFIHSVNPVVRIWGNSAAVYFDFDLDYTVNGTTRRSPGRGVYTFARKVTGNKSWAMAACAASHLVSRTIGDPYPIPSA